MQSAELRYKPENFFLVFVQWGNTSYKPSGSKMEQVCLNSPHFSIINTGKFVHISSDSVSAIYLTICEINLAGIAIGIFS